MNDSSPTRWQWLFLLLLGALALSLIRTLTITKKGQEALREQAERVEQFEQQVQGLERQLEEATSSFELERRVREELHLQKPGESVYRLQPQP